MNSHVITAQDLLDVHSKVSNPKKLESIFKDYKEKVYMVSGRYTPVRLEDDELWISEAHDRSWLFWHHCLVSVAYLIDSYNVNHNKEKLYLAFEIVEKWYEANYPESPSVMGWHDHSTALRLLHIVKLYLVFVELNDEKVLRRLEEVSEKHMEKLSDPDFYMPKHNHGLDQDISLYLASSVLANLPRSQKWNELALNRFWGQVNNIFAQDGSYLEHSPHYIYLMLERLINFYKIVMKSNEKEGENLQKRIVAITKFFIYSLHPDATFPTIGDSESQSFDVNNETWKSLPEDIYSVLAAIKKENELEIDLPLDAFYKDGGYAFFRSDWKNGEDTTQLMFYSAFHSRVHKHHDDLSILLYGHGKPLLIDSGKFTYQYDRAERHYVVSAYGHNTVRLNNSETDISRLNINKSGILSFLNTKNIGYASGFHTLMDGTTHRRMVFYLKPGETVVLDLIKSSTSIDSEIIFNFHPDLRTMNMDGKIVGFNEGNPEIYLENLIGQTNYQKARGNSDPLQGWSSNFYGELHANDMITMKQNGSLTTFATYIHLNEQSSVTDFAWKDDQISFKWKSFTIKLKLTDFYEMLEINGKLFKTQKVFNKAALLEGITNNELEYYRNLTQ
ncbi:heparinase II/III domain-containing protein [Neobacillus vireti]|uniref:heparinase II/III domain-containing protein n=1 Tax=Neobacillus vireti TaxID=220686 RepID=UPI00300000D3